MLNFIANIVIIFSGYYITKLPISPIYFTFVISTIFIPVIIYKRRNFKPDSSIWMAFIFINYLLVTQFLNGGMREKEIHTTFTVLMSIYYYILVSILIYGIEKDKILKICRRFINVTILLLLVEGIYRVSHPNYYFDIYNLANQNMKFYIYKSNSIMYQDSNFVGIFIVTMFFFCEYLKKYHRQDYKIQRIILAILCVLTFSRAAIVGMTLFWVIIRIKDNQSVNGKFKYISIIKNIIILIFVGIGLYGIKMFLTAGGGFDSRLDIFERMFKYIETARIQEILFGNGFGNAINVIGIGSHNFFVTYILDTGVIGLLLLSIFWVVILIKSKFKVFIIMFSFLLVGFSLAGHAIPYLYTIFAIVCNLNKNTLCKGEYDV